MSHTKDLTATSNDVAGLQLEQLVVVGGSTKDAGRVKIGGSGIRFIDTPASTKDSGRVRIGGSGIRY